MGAGARREGKGGIVATEKSWSPTCVHVCALPSPFSVGQTTFRTEVLKLELHQNTLESY